jgi:hypothetical protein
MGETLATELHAAEPPEEAIKATAELEGQAVKFGILK